MECKRLSDRRFCALKYNIVLQGSIFSSGGFCVCCGITILFIYKVLSIVLFEPFKVIVCVVWYCGKIARLDAWRWSAGAVGCCAGLVDGSSWWAVDRLKGLWISKGKTRVRVLYPKKIIPKRTSVLCL